MNKLVAQFPHLTKYSGPYFITGDEFESYSLFYNYGIDSLHSVKEYIYKFITKKEFFSDV